MPSRIEFSTSTASNGDAAIEVVPVVDGVPLTTLVHAFERAADMEPRTEPYGGLIPANFRFERASEHYFARTVTQPKTEKTPLLGCSCGEWGCWPLLARIDVQPDLVRWRDFEQPHRPARDYSALGPFEFDRADYDAAVAALADLWDAELA